MYGGSGTWPWTASTSAAGQGSLGRARPVARRRAGDQCQFQRRRLDLNHLSFRQPAARLTDHLPEAVRMLPEKQAFPLAAGAGTPAEESRQQTRACRSERPGRPGSKAVAGR